MPLAPKNLLVVVSNSTNPRVLGAAGHALSRTPHLDRLAARHPLSDQRALYS